MNEQVESTSSQEIARRNESLARENRVLREKLNQAEEVILDYWIFFCFSSKL